MTAVLARNPLQTLHMTSTNRPNTRRRSAKRDFEEDDAPAPKRPKMEVNGPAKGGGRANGATRKSAKAAAYEEDDDGFQFSRRTTRKSTAKAKAAPEPIPEETAKPQPSRRKKNPTPVPEPEPAQAEPIRKRRSARLSGDSAHVETQPQPVKPVPKRTKKTAPAEKKQPTEEPEERVAHIGVQTPNQNELHVAKKRGEAATKIMLPFADTPVITRNKEMRKGSKNGHRRSSTGLRGRRASSLIDSGLSNALPHSEVEVREFYKYIEQSLPEPRRMKQLLTWCGSRALPEKPSGAVKDANVIMAARAIQQELIEDFASKPELSDWFSREDTTPATVVKKPNPQNVKNEAAIQELEEEIKRLEEEKAAWEALKSSSLPPTTTDPPPLADPPTLSSIDTTLLSPSQAAILTALAPPQPQQPSTSTSSPKPTSPSQTAPSPPFSDFTFRFTTPTALSTHLSTLSSSLEPNIDLLANGVHAVSQYRATAERAADRVLGAAAKALEERDARVREEVGTSGIGTRDLLRGLAGVLGEQGR